MGVGGGVDTPSFAPGWFGLCAGDGIVTADADGSVIPCKPIRPSDRHLGALFSRALARLFARFLEPFKSIQTVNACHS